MRLHKAATRAWLIDILQKGYVVDASCHGSFNFSEPLQSTLSLAANEGLTLGEVLSHSVDLRGLRLLILSACQTASLGLMEAYDEVHNLAAGMIQSGALAVLAALWSIDDKATCLLMVRFAQEWFPHLESEPPAAALARAQHWLRTVTNRQLRDWQVDDFPTSTVEKQDGAKSQTLERNSLEEGRRKPFEVRTTQLGVIDEQDVMKDAIQRLQEWDQCSEDDEVCPYADPVYWAGFQLTGW